MIDTDNKLKTLSQSLIDAVRGVMEGNGSTPKTEKEKDLAAKAPPHDKITHADVLVGRGVLKKHPVTGKLVTKEEVEEVDEATLSAKAARAGKDIGAPGKTFGKIASSAAEKYGSEEAGKRVAGAVLAKMRAKAAHEEVEVEDGEQIDEALDAAARYGDHHRAIKELLKSISQHVDNHKTDALKHRDYRGKKGVNWAHVGDLAHVHNQLADIHDRLAQQGEYKATIGESVELDEAPVDGVAAGSMCNDGHLCATKVFHKEWAEGTPIYSQHAEPDENGDIAWYDVMFEHGIEKMVSTDDLEILMSESHERHGKRKMKEGVELDEARGRPRKNPLPTGQAEEPEPRQHIMQQLQRAKLSMRGGEHVTFKDGTKHHISGAHAAKILDKYAGMKPYEKEAFQKKIGASHTAFKEEL